MHSQEHTLVQGFLHWYRTASKGLPRTDRSFSLAPFARVKPPCTCTKPAPFRERRVRLGRVMGSGGGGGGASGPGTAAAQVVVLLAASVKAGQHELSCLSSTWARCEISSSLSLH